MKGKGLAKGLAVTFATMTKRATTRQYPDVEPDLPPRTRGVIALLEENCTVCMLCARECPDWCIYIDSHKEEVVVPGAARARQRNVLDRFAIDFSLCMYCGICVEACPFDALHWSPEFEYAEYDLRDLLHERDRLRAWVPTVPAPPAHDPNGTQAKEEVTAAKIASGEAPARPARAAAGAAGAERPARPARAAAADGAERPARPERPARAAAADGAERPARPARPAAKAGTEPATTEPAAQPPKSEPEATGSTDTASS